MHSFEMGGLSLFANCLEEVFSETEYSPDPIGLGDIDSGGRVGLAVGALGQALLVKVQLRFSIPNAHERTRASFSTVLRSRVAATRTKKSTGIWRVLPAMRFSRRRGL